MQRFLPYPNYKDAGLPWVGKIPAHWQAARLRYVARIANGTTPARDRVDYWDGGTVPWLNSGQVNDYIVRQARQFITPIAQKESSLRVFPKGSVIIALYGQGKTRGTAAYLNIDATINQALAGIESNHALDDRFLHYILIAGRTYLRNEGRGGSQPNLNCSIIGSFTTPIPPRPEQDNIVHYLRIKDAQIARFIHTKRTLIARLNEQKLRIIDHAVTGGLNPSAPRKPSGVDWLGDVPEHWKIKPLKRWARINVKTLGENTNSNFEFRYVDIGSVQTGRLVKELERMRFADAPSRARRILRRGDTIISTVRTYLKAIWYVNENANDLIASTGFAVLTPEQGVQPEYLSYVIQSSAFINCISANSIGIAYPAISETVLSRFPIVLPPINEQHTIVAHIQSETRRLNDAITHTEAQIALIREYRERLIADAVTGQIDLRGWQPGAEDVPLNDDLTLLADDPSEAGPDDEYPCDDA